MVQFKFKTEDDYRAVSRDSNGTFELSGRHHKIYSTESTDCITFETDLPPIFKQTKDGKWQEMRF